MLSLYPTSQKVGWSIADTSAFARHRPRMYDPRAPWVKRGKGIFRSSIYTKSDVNQMQSFGERSFYFAHLLNFGDTVRELSDVGWLWFREFHLEMSRQVQFPINMSLPWILSEHVILHPANNMLENIFYAMDIYNDAAHTALHHMGQRYVFDEIEAEVNLVFDQLLFLLNKTIYSHFKNAAAMNCLDKDSRVLLEQPLKNCSGLRQGRPKAFAQVKEQFECQGGTGDGLR